MEGRKEREGRGVGDHRGREVVAIRTQEKDNYVEGNIVTQIERDKFRTGVPASESRERGYRRLEIKN